jgi:hypothetical protein
LDNKKPERSSPSPMHYEPKIKEKIIGGGTINA